MFALTEMIKHPIVSIKGLPLSEIRQLLDKGSYRLTEGNSPYIYLEGRKADNIQFIDCQFHHGDFRKTHISNSHFIGCNLTGLDFTDAELTTVGFYGCRVEGMILKPRRYKSVFFRSTDVSKIVSAGTFLQHSGNLKYQQ